MGVIVDIGHCQTFGTVAIGGGRDVDGIIACPSQQNLSYGRMDVGGDYRWDEPTKGILQEHGLRSVLDGADRQYRRLATSAMAHGWQV